MALWVVPSLVSGLAITRQESSCTNPEVYKEWRSLSEDERAQYIVAVSCLSTTDSVLVPGTKRLDDFARIHSALYSDSESLLSTLAHTHTHSKTDKKSLVHLVPAFLPWHRYYLSLYALALRSECSFTGPMPYWDWTIDAPNPAAAPVWDSTLGFGGDGVANPENGDSCVADGPFASWQPMYDGDSVTPRQHCLRRTFSNGDGQSGLMMGAWYSADSVAAVMANEGFEAFAEALETGPHAGVHNSIGGDMVARTSPNDPVFFLHHAQIDRLWTLWQQGNPNARMNDYSASLDDVLVAQGLGGDVTVREVMSTQAGRFCYSY